jgi:hypothetical protein
MCSAPQSLVFDFLRGESLPRLIQVAGRGQGKRQAVKQVRRHEGTLARQPQVRLDDGQHLGRRLLPPRRKVASCVQGIVHHLGALARKQIRKRIG